MSKKKILTFSLALLCSFSLLAFCSCKKTPAESTSEPESQAQIVESTSGIEYTLSSDGKYYVISGYNGTAKKVVCGDTYKELPIKKIGNNAFYNSVIETVTVSASIEEIGDYAFFNCDELTTVNFTKGLKKIGEYAFSACKMLTHVSLPEGLVEICDNAFYSSNVIDVNIPSSIESIGVDVFDKCESLQYNKYDNAFYLGNSENKYVALIFLGKETLASTELDGVEIESTIVGNPMETSCSVHSDTKVIAGGAFEHHSFLTRVTVSQNVIAIGDRAFSACFSLASVTLPKSLKTIGVSAFAYCKSLSSINLPESLETLGDGAFSHCGITMVVIPDTIKEIAPFTFNECYKLNEVYLGSNVTKIGAHAFFGCFSLKSVIFENYFTSSLTDIGAFAFGECNQLTSIMLPSSLVSIEEKIFSDYITHVYCFHTKNTWASANLNAEGLLDPYSGKIYLYSQSQPALNQEETDYDGKYFFLNEDGNKIIWKYTIVDGDVEYTYSAEQPAVNQDKTAYVGNFFFYNVKGAPILWRYVVRIGGVDCTYSHTQPALNEDQTDYDGNYFYYDELGVARKWILSND